jgi:hypothetical protein
VAKNLVWLALGVLVLIVIGSIVVSLLGLLLKLVLYLVLGALVVGGGYYVYARTRRSVRGGPRQLR